LDGSFSVAKTLGEEAFKQSATPLISKDAKNSFIDSSRQSLEHLRLAALTQVRKFLEGYKLGGEEEKALFQEWEDELKKLENKIAFSKISEIVINEINKYLTPYLGKFSIKEINRIKDVFEEASGVKNLPLSLNAAFEVWKERALKINNAFHVIPFRNFEASRAIEAYRVWLERQGDLKEDNLEIFAEQVAYVFFVRLLLIRVLEDKELIKPRLASNGGFSDWRNYIKTYFKELDGIGILDQNYCNILTQKAGHYYLHFFQQPIFDWFMPDDFLFIETLEFLCRYNFQEVASDIIGFTYEEYIQKTARKSKGHFLTRDEVVEYMLDLLDYNGPYVLGRRVLDPACGSGSFLVHAAIRYRSALVVALCNQYNIDEKALYAHSTYRRELARRYLDDLITLFFGMELNPFACYLAEMNMLIQGLDDLSVLQQSGEVYSIERFHIYNTDSLNLPREILADSKIVSASSTL
jgi:type I restriction-modification system DNA methylase subunit